MAYYPIPIDEAVGSAIFIDHDHHAVHEGESYTAFYVANAVGSGSNVDIRMLPPNTSTRIHLVWNVWTNEESEFYLYEAGNVTGGTGLTAYNRDRNSGNTATLTVAHTPTVTTTGTLIHHAYFGNTAATTHIGGEGHSQNERILGQNVTYLLRVTSRAAGDDISILLEWYEEG